MQLIIYSQSWQSFSDMQGPPAEARIKPVLHTQGEQSRHASQAIVEMSSQVSSRESDADLSTGIVSFPPHLFSGTIETKLWIVAGLP